MDRLQPLAGETRRDSCFVFLEKKKKEKETIAQIIPENKMKSYQRIDPSTRNDSSRPFFLFFSRSDSSAPRATFKRNYSIEFIAGYLWRRKTFRIGGESRVKREHVAYRLTRMARPRGWTRSSYGKIHEPKKASLPPSAGDFLSVKWNEARGRSIKI